MTESPRILLVEDDPAIQRSVRKGLMELDFHPLTASTLADARELILNNEIDLLVLDLGLPDGDGLDFLKEIRASGNRTPVILLTARDTVRDKVAGLDLGADDYIVKPFDFMELTARIRARLRRSTSEAANAIRVGDLEIDLIARVVKHSGQAIELTPREFDVIAYLAANAGQPVSRSVLTREVWKIQSRMTSMDNVIDVLMSRLREKVDGGHEVKLIQTIRGLGFMLKANE